MRTLLIALTLVFVTLGATLKAQNPAVNESGASMVQELESIRQRLGGGIGSSFSELGISRQDLNREFRNALNNLNDHPANSMPESFREPRHQTRPINRQEQIEILRSTARKLEESAAQLENVNLFGQADNLREQASVFWQEARELIRNPQPSRLVAPKSEAMSD